MNASDASNDTGTTYMADLGQARPTLKSRFMKLGLAVAFGLVAGWLLQMAYIHWKDSQEITLFSPTASALGQPSGLAMQPSVVLPQPAIGAELLIGGLAHSLDQGPIALPTGSRIQIRFSSPYRGQLTLSAMHPTGQHNSTLWQTSVKKTQIVTSPTLRLEGTRGRETLVVVIQPQSPGQQPVIRHIDLWHY